METSAPEQTPIVMPDRPYSQRDLPAPAQPGQPANLMQALAAAAADPRMDVVKVKELYAIHKEMMDRAAESAFNDAMARAQAEIQPVAAKAWNDHTKSAYAKLEAIDKQITPIHARHGLSISYDTETKNDADPIPQGYLRVIAWVRHSGGHKVRHHIDLPPDDSGSQGKTNKTMVQAIGSTNTYGRKYLKLMIFNVSTFDDRDGNRTSGRSGAAELAEKARADHLAAIEAASTEDELKRAFGQAFNAANAAGDKQAIEDFKTARDNRRGKFVQRGGGR